MAQSFQVINPGNKVSTIKLNGSKFLLWKFQIRAALEGNGLQAYVNEDSELPPQFLSVTEGTTVVLKENPAFLHWKRQDCLITWWLLGLMSEDILGDLLCCTTAKEIWSSLLEIFTS